MACEYIFVKSVFAVGDLVDCPHAKSEKRKEKMISLLILLVYKFICHPITCHGKVKNLGNKD